MHEAFISDFDGTITLKDFYWLMIEKYLDKDFYQRQYDSWQAKDITDLQFLNSVFNNINQNEQTIREDIISIPIDHTVIDFINWFTEQRGDFYIVSAGCGYYIEILLEHHGLRDRVGLFANPGYFQEGNIYMQHYQGEFYSDIYGIDKGKIVDNLKKKHSKTYFAGDSRPDMQAALNADRAFARQKTQLLQMLGEQKADFLEFADFEQIKKMLADQSLLTSIT